MYEWKIVKIIIYIIIIIIVKHNNEFGINVQTDIE